MRSAAAVARGLVARHRAFAAALLVAAALRAMAELGYRWAIWFNDSFDYLAIAQHLRPDPLRPIGYPALLRLLQPLHSFAAVTVAQHALGLGIAVIVYALLRVRFGLPGWAATLAAVPVLFDAFQIQLEQLLLADTLFTFLAVAGVAVACWPAPAGRRVSVRRAAAAGVLLAAAAAVRPVGVALIAVVMCYLAVCRVGWRALAAAGAAAFAPLAGYAIWFHALTGQYALDSTGGVYLWGRTAAFADCRVIKPPPAEAWLCPRLPAARRAASSSQVWQPTSPFHWRPGQAFSPADNDLAMRFAGRAIAAQPLAYARTVLVSTGRAFTWNRGPYPTGYTASLYTFAGAKTWLPTWPARGGRSAASVAQSYAGGHAVTRAVAPYSAIMRWYQRYAYLRGPLLALILAVPPVAELGLLRSRRSRGLSRPRARQRGDGGQPAAGQQAAGQTAAGQQAAGQQAAGQTAAWQTALRRSTWLCWSSAMALLVIPSVTVDFDYRYVLPVVPFGCLAAALATRRYLLTAGWWRAKPAPARDPNARTVSIRTVRELTRSDG